MTPLLPSPPRPADKRGFDVASLVLGTVPAVATAATVDVEAVVEAVVKVVVDTAAAAAAAAAVAVAAATEGEIGAANGGLGEGARATVRGFEAETDVESEVGAEVEVAEVGVGMETPTFTLAEATAVPTRGTPAEPANRSPVAPNGPPVAPRLQAGRSVGMGPARRGDREHARVEGEKHDVGGDGADTGRLAAEDSDGDGGAKCGAMSKAGPVEWQGMEACGVREQRMAAGAGSRGGVAAHGGGGEGLAARGGVGKGVAARGGVGEGAVVGDVGAAKAAAGEDTTPAMVNLEDGAHTVVLVDVETTGLCARTHRVIQLGAKVCIVFSHQIDHDLDQLDVFAVL